MEFVSITSSSQDFLLSLLKTLLKLGLDCSSVLPIVVTIGSGLAGVWTSLFRLLELLWVRASAGLIALRLALVVDRFTGLEHVDSELVDFERGARFSGLSIGLTDDELSGVVDSECASVMLISVGDISDFFEFSTSTGLRKL